MLPDAPLDESRLADVLETSRRFLLAIANAELPPALRAKGGASDLVQQTLAAAHRSRHQFTGRTLADLRAWLRAILINELAMFRRRFAAEARDVAREVPLGAADGVSRGGTPLAELARSEGHARLAEAVGRLPPEARLAVVLRVERGLGFAEIGERLGRTEEAARKVFARAVEALRETVPEAV